MRLLGGASKGVAPAPSLSNATFGITEAFILIDACDAKPRSLALVEPLGALPVCRGVALTGEFGAPAPSPSSRLNCVFLRLPSAKTERKQKRTIL